MHAVQCAGAVEEERARRLAAARAYAEELDSLAERPPSTWPASVHALVKQCESAAAEVRSPNPSRHRFVTQSIVPSLST